MIEEQINAAAERLAENIRTKSLSDPLLRYLDAVTTEFLRQKGFDISTRVGCIAV